LCDTLSLPEALMLPATPTPAVRRFGAFEINFQSGELRKNGMRLRLSGQPFQVLAVLVEHPGDVVTREELNSKLWPADTFVDFDHGLNNAVARIREVLEDSPETPRYIETVPRRGYRFIAALTDIQPAPVPLSADESKVSPAHEINRAGASAPSVLPTEKRFASTRLRMLLVGTALLALCLVVLVLYRSRGATGTSQPAIKSLAVLPLKNLSGDPTQAYLADGITEALIGRLARIHDLRVISRTSAMHYRDTQLSMPEIARTLRVDALVEGSVIREGSRIRVHAQLIRGATDEHFWSETYDRELRDVLTLESEVAQSIAAKVEVTVTGKERERLRAVRSVTPEVYENYLKGRLALDKSNSRTDIEESINYFEKAIKRDATFAPAYVGLANGYDDLATVFIGVPPGEVRPKVIRAVRKALELDPELAEAHALLADVQQQQWQWAEAEAEYRRALELNPNDAAAHRGLASWLLYQGRMDEALVWSRRARELDPLGDSPIGMGWILFCAHRYDEAIHELRSKLAVRPDDAVTLWVLGFVLIANRQAGEAIPVLERSVSVSDRSPGVIGVLVRAYAHAGRRTDALRLLAELKRRKQVSYVPAAAFVNAYLGLGDYDQAFAWLEQAYKEQSNILQFLKVLPFFDPVREDPRFKDLVRRVGLD
jgi:TolB-like protein/DNA-binding winged helix-turn-helix (wHTH) protein/tetratricopeptide (TPR) repeat protein